MSKKFHPGKLKPAFRIPEMYPFFFNKKGLVHREAQRLHDMLRGHETRECDDLASHLYQPRYGPIEDCYNKGRLANSIRSFYFEKGDILVRKPRITFHSNGFWDMDRRPISVWGLAESTFFVMEPRYEWHGYEKGNCLYLLYEAGRDRLVFGKESFLKRI